MSESKQSRGINWSAISAIAAITAVVIGVRYNAKQLELSTSQLSQQRQQFEAQLERQMKPFVAFDRVTFSFPIESSDVQNRRFDFIRKDGMVVDQIPIPSLTNYGPGPALHVEVSYEGTVKTLSPTAPMHLLPQQQARYFAIPGAINDASDPKRSTKETVLIRCRDSRGRQHQTEQEYTCSVDVENKTIQFQFGTITTLSIDFTIPEYSRFSSWSAPDVKPTYDLRP